ncbi:helix-turn-helix domain-containing protein [Brevibacillus agri]
MCLVDLAKATGLSVVSLRLAEQNRTSLTPTNLRIIASVLGVSVAYLGCFESLSEDTLGQRIEKQGYIMVIHRVSSQDFWV